MERKQFTFYRSFWEAAQSLPDADRLSLYDAIAGFALNGSETERTPSANAVFCVIRPFLESAAKMAAGGSKKEGSAKVHERLDKGSGKGSERVAEQGKGKGKGKYKETLSKERVKKKTTVQCAEKKHFAEFVTMTDAEHDALIAKYGAADTARLIEILDNYKGEKGKQYASDYRAILTWCVQRLAEEKSHAPSNDNRPRERTSARKNAAWVRQFVEADEDAV